MEEEIVVTRSQIVKALDQWDADAEAGNWKDNPEPGNNGDAADYFIGLLKKVC